MGQSAGINEMRLQCRAIGSALESVLRTNAVLRQSSAGRDLKRLSTRLSDPRLSNLQLNKLFPQAVQELKDVMTAHHEAGHVLAYRLLTPRHRIRLDDVQFTGRVTDADVEAGVTYTWIAEPCWPDPDQSDEVVRELACVLAGKRAEPPLIGHVHLTGSDRADQMAIMELLDMLPEQERREATERALALLEQMDVFAQVPTVASYLYGRWASGDTVVLFAELEALLGEVGEPVPDPSADTSR